MTKNDIMGSALTEAAKRSSRVHDDGLKAYAIAFKSLPEFDPVGGLAVRPEALELLDAKPCRARHIHTFPGTWQYGVKFTFRRQRCWLAYGKMSQLEDIIRYADALTYLLTPFKERGAQLETDKGYSFSRKDAEDDIALWRETRPDIIELLEAVIDRLHTLDIIATPAERAAERYEQNVHSATRTRTVKGKIESVLADFREDFLAQLLVSEDKLTARLVASESHIERRQTQSDEKIQRLIDTIEYQRSEIALMSARLSVVTAALLTTALPNTITTV